MTRATLRRVTRLEKQTTPRPTRCFRSLEQDDAVFEAWKAALLASGEVSEDDLFIRRVFVDHPRDGSL